MSKSVRSSLHLLDGLRKSEHRLNIAPIHGATGSCCVPIWTEQSMPIPYVIDALRRLADEVPAGRGVLAEAADHLARLLRELNAPPRQSPEWILPPPEPQR